MACAKHVDVDTERQGCPTNTFCAAVSPFHVSRKISLWNSSYLHSRWGQTACVCCAQQIYYINYCKSAPVLRVPKQKIEGGILVSWYQPFQTWKLLGGRQIRMWRIVGGKLLHCSVVYVKNRHVGLLLLIVVDHSAWIQILEWIRLECLEWNG